MFSLQSRFSIEKAGCSIGLRDSRSVIPQLDAVERMCRGHVELEEQPGPASAVAEARAGERARTSRRFHTSLAGDTRPSQLETVFTGAGSAVVEPHQR
jgi:hypothetical protein